MIAPEAFQAILFDLDGTLIASHEALDDAYRTFLRTRALEPSAAEFARLDGASLSEIVASLRSAHRIDEPSDTLELEYRALVAERYVSVAPLPGADALLESLSAARRLALVTSAPRELVDVVLERRGWVSRFSVVVTGDDGAAKPDPELYRICLSRLRVASDRALAIEDGPHGVAAAVAAGLVTLGIASSPDRADELRRAGASGVVSALDMLSALVA